MYLCNLNVSPGVYRLVPYQYTVLRLSLPFSKNIHQYLHDRKFVNSSPKECKETVAPPFGAGEVTLPLANLKTLPVLI